MTTHKVLTLLLYSLITISITILIFILPIIIRILLKKWTEKASSFECGVSLNRAPRKPFSLRFFLLIVLFIIFDIEIALLLGIPLLTPWRNTIIIFTIIFLIILTIGLFYEWLEGSLNWKT